MQEQAKPRSEFSLRATLVLLGCALGLTLNLPSVFNGSLTVFMKPITADTGWTRAEVSLGYSLALAAVVLALPWVSRFADRVGPRRVIGVGAPFFAISVASLGLIPTIYPVFLLACVVVGLVASTTYNALYYALLPHFFERRLGLAFGVASAGTGLGLVLAPILGEALISELGWRGAYVVLGLISGVGLLSVAILFLRDPPTAKPRTEMGPNRSGSALGSIKFWVIGSTYFLSGMAMVGMSAHLVPLLTDRGMTAGSAAQLASYLGLGVLVSRVVSGLLLDYVDAGLLGAAFFLIAAGGIGILIFQSDPTWVLIAVLFMGSALGAEGGILSYVTRRVFGIEGYAGNLGSMMSVFIAGALTGPLVGGAVFDVTGSYDLALYGFVGATLVAAMTHATVTLGMKRALAAS